MRLCAAQVGDAVALAAVHAQGFTAPWTAADIAEVFDTPGTFGFLVTDDGTPVGMAVCRAIAGEAEILTIAVIPDRRGRGIGQALVQAMIGAARARGATEAFLEVGADNPEAEKLYASVGFRLAGRRAGYYDRGAQGRVDALVMRRDLNADDSSDYS